VIATRVVRDWLKESSGALDGVRVDRRESEPGGRAGAAFDAHTGTPGARRRWRCPPRLSCQKEWMARFVNAQLPEVVQPFWAALQRGEFIADAAAAAGTHRKQGTRWVAPTAVRYVQGERQCYAAQHRCEAKSWAPAPGLSSRARVPARDAASWSPARCH
jgi:hypothetical protein